MYYRPSSIDGLLQERFISTIGRRCFCTFHVNIPQRSGEYDMFPEGNEAMCHLFNYDSVVFSLFSLTVEEER